jgi:hypothetical protein
MVGGELVEGAGRAAEDGRPAGVTDTRPLETGVDTILALAATR